MVGVALLDELSSILLFIGVVLIYLATAAFAAGFKQMHWLGKKASWAFATTSLFAALCVCIKLAYVLKSPHDPMWSFIPWYTLPGQIFSIPALPWIMPCLYGVVLLRLAGDK
jgi:hypothetical protein